MIIDVCDTVGCFRPSETVFFATEPGMLAGKVWDVGDAVKFCWPCARHVYAGTDPLEKIEP